MDEHPAIDATEHYEASMEGEEALEEETVQPATTPIAAAPVAAQPKPQIGAPTRWQRVVAFYRECVRVFKITKKPDKPEFITVVKISGAGILIIGAIGFLIHLVGRLFA